MNNLKESIQDLIIKSFRDLNMPHYFRDPIVGFAQAKDPAYEELKNIVGGWHKLPQDFLPGARSVITYFVPFSKDLAKSLTRTNDPTSLDWGRSYNIFNSYCLEVNDKVLDLLKDKGYEGHSILMSETYDIPNHKSSWSHKNSAAITGIGDFMANRIFMTEKGCAGRLATIITSADLPPTEDRVKSKCILFRGGRCGVCFNVCPARALKADSFDKDACQAVTFKNEEFLRLQDPSLEGATVCGKCVSMCPFAYID